MTSDAAFAEARRDRVLTRLMALLNVTQDLEHNQQDTAFAADHENEIIYCLDQTLIETFLRPAEKYRIFEGFHGQIWSEDWSRDRRRWSAVSAQSALVGSKWLFSGRLIGQRNARIYMSEWHLREFYVRYQKHKEAIEQQFARNADALLNVFLETTEILRDDKDVPVAQKLRSARRNRDVLKLGEDIDALLNRRVAPDIAWRFALSRLAASVLARDDAMQRVQYLHELHDPNFIRRLSPLHTRFQTRTEAEREDVRSRASRWYDRLRKEQQRRKEDAGANHTRPTRNFRADAVTMAYLEWIADGRLGARERIVLICGGDELLLNAHRRWRIEDPSRPHLIRRAEQYAPMYNFSDSPNDISRLPSDTRARDVFGRTRAAVEISLAPLNLSPAVKEAAAGEEDELPFTPRPPAIENGRQYLAWLLAYTKNPSTVPALSPFLDALKPDWVAQRAREFDKLKSDWQELERARLGVCYDELRSALAAFHEVHTRLTKLRSEETEGAIDRARLGEKTNKGAARAAFTGYVGGLLDEITSRSIAIWIPLAIDFVRAASTRPHFRTRRKSRAPISLQLKLPTKRRSDPDRDGRYDLVGVIEHWIAGGKQSGREIMVITRWARQAHPPRPDVVFAVAAALALRLGHHSDAGFFAQLALTSVPEGQVDDAEENKREYAYLYALTRRLRLGSRAPDTWNGDEKVWRRELDAIVADLTVCEDKHAKDGQPREQLRRVRAISERAAARMFFATWALSTHEMSPVRARRCFGDWARELALAADDLKAAIRRLDSLLESASLDDAAADAARRLSTQVYVNWAAIVVLFTLASAMKLRPPFELDAAMSERVREVMLNFDEQGLPPVVKVDVLAFRLINGTDEELLRRIRTAANSDADLKLAVDDALFRLVLKYIH